MSFSLFKLLFLTELFLCLSVCFLDYHFICIKPCTFFGFVFAGTLLLTDGGDHLFVFNFFYN